MRLKVPLNDKVSFLYRHRALATKAMERGFKNRKAMSDLAKEARKELGYSVNTYHYDVCQSLQSAWKLLTGGE